VKFKRPLSALVATCFAAGLLAIGVGVLITHRFEHIDSGSLLRFLVDSELREAPVGGAGTEFFYTSYPADGTARGMDRVLVKAGDGAAPREQLVRYFIERGYGFEAGSEMRLRRGEDEVLIEKRGEYWEVSKYL